MNLSNTSQYNTASNSINLWLATPEKKIQDQTQNKDQEIEVNIDSFMAVLTDLRTSLTTIQTRQVFHKIDTHKSGGISSLNHPFVKWQYKNIAKNIRMILAVFSLNLRLHQEVVVELRHHHRLKIVHLPIHAFTCIT